RRLPLRRVAPLAPRVVLGRREPRRGPPRRDPRSARRGRGAPPGSPHRTGDRPPPDDVRPQTAAPPGGVLFRSPLPAPPGAPVRAPSAPRATVKAPGAAR